VRPIPAELRGRHERRGLAAVTYDKLIVTPSETLLARWADIGGRWYAAPMRSWMDGEELWLGDEGAATVLLARRRGGRTFLVEPRHQAAFDADTDAERDQWIDRAEPGDERGYRAFLQVDLAACWRRMLSDLRTPSERASALARLAAATLHIERDEDPAAEEPAIEVRGALVEGFDHVDPAALLEAALDAGHDARGQAHTDWYRVLDGVAPAALPGCMPDALRARLAALRAG
jgi:hypothetical protein